MSLPRPSGLKPPSSTQSRIGRPSALPPPRSQTPVGGVSANPGAAPSRALSPQPSEDGSASSKSINLPPPSQPTTATGTEQVDDFKIGDRIWVSGNKPGIIAFLGETQFAPGEWAGVVLDEPIGKNDGSVMGVRYFQCEAKRGVFSRVTKLSHTHQLTMQTPRPVSQASSGDHANTAATPRSARTPSTTGSVGVHAGAGDSRMVAPATNGTSLMTPQSSSIPARPSSRMGMSSSQKLSTSQSSLHKGGAPHATPGQGAGVTAMKLPGTMPGGVKVGDRVLVSGSKSGVLRYIGETDFAKGVWAGVELDEPYGKNDGAVAGKRYFDCKPLHGLFAPVHKISRAGGSISSTPSPHSRPLMSTSLRLTRERSGSQESVSSISSTTSSVSRSRVRLGVTSLHNQFTPQSMKPSKASKTGARPSTLNLTATTAALQKALKEKEEHIEQLLRERDLERSEVARAAAHVDEAEGKMSTMKSEQDQLRIDAEEQINTYKTTITDLENEKSELQAFLEKEKGKVEDLQFQLEEAVLKDEGDGQSSAASELQIKELERQLSKEKERADTMEKDLLELKSKVENQQKTISESETEQTTYLDQIEDLTYKLTQAEAKLKEHESARLEDGAKTSQVSIELAEKSSRVRELEDELSEQKREVANMSQELSDMRDELNLNNNKRIKQEEHVQELTSSLKRVEEEHKSVTEELRSSNSNAADLQRQLAASQAKAEELTSDRTKLEEQMSELMKNSGDSSSQLAAINDQLTEKNRRVEDLQNALSSSSRSLAKVTEEYEKYTEVKEKEMQESAADYENRLSRQNDEINELNATIEKSKSKLAQVTDSLAAEKAEAVERKEGEIRELKQLLDKTQTDLTEQQDKTTAHKQLLDKITSERDALQHDKQQVEKKLKRAEDEKATATQELMSAKVEVAKLKEQAEQAEGGSTQLQDSLDKLTLELEYAKKSKEEIEKSIEVLSSEKDVIIGEKESLQKELLTLKVDSGKKDIRLEELQKEVEKVHAESNKKAEDLMLKSQSETELFTHELETLKSSLKATQEELELKEFQLADLEAQVEQGKALETEKELLLKKKADLEREKEEAEEKCRGLELEVEKQSQKADELDSEVRTLRASEGALKREGSNLEAQLAQMEGDLVRTRAEVAEAQAQAAAAAENVSGDAMYQQLREEVSGSQGQVDFLNSVIVELQAKNTELQARLSAMEDSGIHTNGDVLSSVGIEATPPMQISRAPPRLFCDICDMFDLHDTEDCPKQAMSSSPEPTRHHGDVRQARAYCEICEVFGHWTSDCDDEQTF